VPRIRCLVRERLRRQQLGRNREKRRETRMYARPSRGRYRTMGTRAHICTYGVHTANFSPTNLQTHHRTNPPSTGPSICGCTRRSSSLVQHGGSTCLNPRAAANSLARDRRDRKDTRPLLRCASLPSYLILLEDPRHLPWPLDVAKGKPLAREHGSKNDPNGIIAK
jgi:hypothetical protein